jgi:hypothetical protein
MIITKIISTLLWRLGSFDEIITIVLMWVFMGYIHKTFNSSGQHTKSLANWFKLDIACCQGLGIQFAENLC